VTVLELVTELLQTGHLDYVVDVSVSGLVDDQEDLGVESVDFMPATGTRAPYQARGWVTLNLEAP
jgi:hypothetical protein